MFGGHRASFSTQKYALSYLPALFLNLEIVRVCILLLQFLFSICTSVVRAGKENEILLLRESTQ